MQIFDDLISAPCSGRRPIVTLGVFDGVHLGHQAVLKRLVARAREAGTPALAVTFNLHPRLTLGLSAPPGITSFDNRLRLMDAQGVDAVWVLSFTREMARLPARDFAEEYFVRRLGAQAVVLGESARFGCDRGGDVGDLAVWGRNWGLEVESVEKVRIGFETVSSTAIRLAVERGDLKIAAAMLGRPPSVVGTVMHGQGRGRKSGFPTINLDPHHELRPPPGVYVTRALVDGAELPSVTCIGRKPTEAEIAAGVTGLLVETHLFDYDYDLYGKVVEVSFVDWIREMRYFSAENDLLRQMENDCAEARRKLAI